MAMGSQKIPRFVMFQNSLDFKVAISSWPTINSLISSFLVLKSLRILAGLRIKGFSFESHAQRVKELNLLINLESSSSLGLVCPRYEFAPLTIPLL